jgi:hypothetical protein
MPDVKKTGKRNLRLYKSIDPEIEKMMDAYREVAHRKYYKDLSEKPMTIHSILIKCVKFTIFLMIIFGLCALIKL